MENFIAMEAEVQFSFTSSQVNVTCNLKHSSCFFAVRAGDGYQFHPCVSCVVRDLEHVSFGLKELNPASSLSFTLYSTCMRGNGKQHTVVYQPVSTRLCCGTSS